MANTATNLDQQGGAPEETRGGARFFSRRRAVKSPSEALQPEAAPPPPSGPPPSKRNPMLSAISGFLSFLLVAFAACGGLAFMAVKQVTSPGPLASDKVVYIAPRSALVDSVDIADQLEQESVIDSSLLFKLALLVDGQRGSLKAGEYLFKAHASMRDVIDTMVNSRQILHSVTVPEGLTTDQIIQRIKDSEFLAGDVRDYPREGVLLPETYRVARGMSRNELLKKMQDDQTKLIDQIWNRRATDLPLRSKYEMVTLASIVEKETGKADERSRIAGVFLNRLQKRMRLQSDPTIVYGLVGGKGTLGRGILRSEIDKPTAYNTYLIEGLPPGPIANPGRAALEAVANPSRTKELYFVADGTGGHVFAETLDQHQKNVARWRQIEKDQKDRAAAAATAGAQAPAGAAPVDRLPASDLPSPPPGPPARDQRGELLEPDPSFGGVPTRIQNANRVTGDEIVSTFGGAMIEKSETPPLPPLFGETGLLSIAGHHNFAPRQTAQAKPAPGKPTNGGSLAGFKMGPGVEELGFTVAGAAQRPQLDGPMSDAEDSAPVDQSIVPVSATRRADQKARAARFGASAGDDSLPADDPLPSAATAYTQVQPNPSNTRRIFDASEGTALDPLRNKSWDLNSTKTVPSLTALTQQR